MRKKLLCITPDFDAPFVINLRQPLEVLKGSGALTYSVVKEKDATIHDVFGHDAVLFFRTSTPAMLKLLYFAKLTGKPVIFAVDDNFFELAQSEIGALDPVRLRAHERFILEADRVLLYSSLMMERVGNLNKNSVKMVPGLDFSLLEGLENQEGHGRIRVVYATSRYKKDILSGLFIPAISKILEEYSGQVEMHFWGYVPEEFKEIPGVHFMPITDYDTYIRRLCSGGFDIGLAPLKDDKFHRSKTNTKFRDYGACGIAGVYSDVDVYSDCIKDGETGILVENTDEGWYQGIKRLIENPGLMSSIKAAAFEYVRGHYDIKRVAADLLQVIDDTFREKKYAVITGHPPNHLFEIRTPKVLYIPLNYKISKNFKKFQENYGYPIDILRNRFLRSVFAFRLHDVIVFDALDNNPNKKMADKALSLNKKIINLEDSSGAEIIDFVDFFYKKILIRHSKPYKFSFRLMRVKLKPYRSAISLYLFKKTGLKRLETFFRINILKPIKKGTGKVFRFSSAR